MKPLLLISILIGTLSLAGCSNSDTSIKPSPGSGGVLQTNESGSILHSTGSSGTGATTLVKPEKCIRLFDLRIRSSEDYRRFEFTFRGECPTQKEPKKIDFFDNKAFTISTGQKAMLRSMISGYGFGMMSGPEEKYHESWKGKNGDISITAGPLMQAGMDTEKTTRIGSGYSILVVVDNIFLIGIDEIPEKDIKQQYEDILWTMKNGFRELPNIIQGKDGFDWKSAEIISATFDYDGIQISDKNGVQKSILVRVASSKDLSGICDECQNNLIEICTYLGGSCRVESASAKRVRWEHSLKTTDMYSTEYFETDVSTGNTKLLKREDICFKDGPEKEIIPCGQGW